MHLNWLLFQWDAQNEFSLERQTKKLFVNFMPKVALKFVNFKRTFYIDLLDEIGLKASHLIIISVRCMKGIFPKRSQSKDTLGFYKHLSFQIFKNIDIKNLFRSSSLSCSSLDIYIWVKFSVCEISTFHVTFCQFSWCWLN